MSLSIRMEMRVFLRPLTEDVHIPDSRTSSSIEGFLQASRGSSGRCFSAVLLYRIRQKALRTMQVLYHHSSRMSEVEVGEKVRSEK